MKKNIEKPIISTLFTDKELKELNFSPKEIAEIEEAEIISQIADIMPSTEQEMDAFFARFWLIL